MYDSAYASNTYIMVETLMETCVCQLFEAIAFQLNKERGKAVVGEIVWRNKLLEAKGIDYPYTSSIGCPSDAIFKSWLRQDMVKLLWKG